MYTQSTNVKRELLFQEPPYAGNSVSSSETSKKKWGDCLWLKNACVPATDTNREALEKAQFGDVRGIPWCFFKTTIKIFSERKSRLFKSGFDITRFDTNYTVGRLTLYTVDCSVDNWFQIMWNCCVWKWASIWDWLEASIGRFRAFCSFICMLIGGWLADLLVACYFSFWL